MINTPLRYRSLHISNLVFFNIYYNPALRRYGNDTTLARFIVKNIFGNSGIVFFRESNSPHPLVGNVSVSFQSGSENPFPLNFGNPSNHLGDGSENAGIHSRFKCINLNSKGKKSFRQKTYRQISRGCGRSAEKAEKSEYVRCQ